MGIIRKDLQSTAARAHIARFVVIRGDDVARSDTEAAPETTVKMADVSGTQLSEETGAEPEPRPRQARPWSDLHMSGKIGISAELPETLGFYDISAVRRKQREPSAGNVKPPRPMNPPISELVRVIQLFCFGATVKIVKRHTPHFSVLITPKRFWRWTSRRLKKTEEGIVISNN